MRCDEVNVMLLNGSLYHRRLKVSATRLANETDVKPQSGHGNHSFPWRWRRRALTPFTSDFDVGLPAHEYFRSWTLSVGRLLLFRCPARSRLETACPHAVKSKTGGLGQAVSRVSPRVFIGCWAACSSLPAETGENFRSFPSIKRHSLQKPTKTTKSFRLIIDLCFLRFLL